MTPLLGDIHSSYKILQREATCSMERTKCSKSEPEYALLLRARADNPKATHLTYYGQPGLHGDDRETGCYHQYIARATVAHQI